MLAVGAGVGEGEFVNRAQAMDGVTGRPLSGEATATVRVVPDQTFDCTDVFGKVFNDLNRNGVQDEGEAGLPGVRVVTAQGLEATTDPYGRLHITCAITPNEIRQLMASGDIGSLAAADAGHGQADDVNFAAQPESSCRTRAAACQNVVGAENVLRAAPSNQRPKCPSATSSAVTAGDCVVHIASGTAQNYGLGLRTLVGNCEGHCGRTDIRCVGR